jgi:head-tail adaptor
MPGAGDLRDRYRFDLRGSDANGDPLGDWEPGFEVSAHTTWLRGSETVMSQRLQGTQPVILTIRSSAQARTINSAFRAVNTRTGFVFNITGVSPTRDDPGFLDILAVGGGAAG